MTQNRGPSEPIPIRFDRILFTTDFSPTSATALPYAAALARRFGSMLYVAHVIPPESYAHLPPGERETALARMRQEAGERINADLAAAPLQGIAHQVALHEGDLWSVLSVLIEEHDIDLIITGMHGKHGIQKLLSGSIAEEISRLAMRPVLLIGPEVTLPPETEMRIERILHLTDFASESRRAMDYAYALAKAYEAHLYFLHIVDNVPDERLSTKMPAEAFFRLQLMEKRWPESQEGIAPEFLLDFGSQEGRTLEAAEKQNIQLMVLSVPGTSHPDLTAHLPGPLAYNIASHARCPVLAVRGVAEPSGSEPRGTP
jgi:nucleotide-binding universal stress UspA family protein